MSLVDETREESALSYKIMKRIRLEASGDEVLERSTPSPMIINHEDEMSDSYDNESIPLPPANFRESPDGIGWFAAALLIVNTALGGGLLNFPKAFHEGGGILTATIVQLVLVVFIVPALLILSYCSDFNEGKTMQDVLYYTWGKAGQRLCSMCMVLYCFGTSITYMIIVGDQLDQIFAAIYGDSFCVHWYMNRNFTMLLSCTLIILPLCYPKKIDFLKIASSVGVVAIIYVVFLIVAQYFTGGYVPGDIKTRPDKWTDVFLVVPTLCFAYQCHVSIIPIYSCLKQRNIKNFSYSVYTAIVICMMTYTIAAGFGYLTFGSNIASDVLKSYNSHYPSVLVANVALATKIYVSYPVNLFCGREAISDMWVDFAQSRFGVNDSSFFLVTPSEKTRRVLIATIWFFASLTLAVLLPNIGSVIKLLGSLAALFIFVFPGLCLLRITLQEDSYSVDSSRKMFWLQIVSGMYLALGAFIFGCVFTQGIIVDFFNEPQVDIPVCVVPS